jgi:hypothetical protein
MRRGGGGPTVLERTAEGGTMNRLLIAARLRPDAYDQAEALLRKGPPFEPEAIGLHRHGAYLSASEVVFVFEAPEVEWIVSDLGNDPILSTAFAPWRAILDGPPRVAHELYYWSRDETQAAVELER